MFFPSPHHGLAASLVEVKSLGSRAGHLLLSYQNELQTINQTISGSGICSGCKTYCV